MSQLKHKGPVKVPAPPPPAPALPAIACNVSTAAAMTVGQKTEIICPIQGTGITSTSTIRFQNEDASQSYAVEFLGQPVINAENLSQTFTSYKVGGHEISKVTLTIDGKKYAVSPFNLNVKSVLPPAGGAQPPPGQQDQQGQREAQQAAPTPFPIYDPEKVPAPWWWWALWVGLAIIFLAFLIWQIIKWVKERKRMKEMVPEKELTPQELFLSRIRKLESRGLHQRGEYKAFALELTNILKTSIGSYLKFQAEDMTSEELLDVLERRYRVFFSTAGLSLKVTLADLDQIKFAKIETDAPKCNGLLDSALGVGRALYGAPL